MNIFESLINANTAPGAEGAVAEIITEYLKDISSEIKMDSMGNLIVKIGNDTESCDKIAVFAAMDAPGLVVTYIEDNGNVRVAPLGNIDYKSVCFGEITNGKITGILLPDSKDSDGIDKSYVNFGFSDGTEAKTHISQGDVLYFSKPVTALQNGSFAGLGLGNKAVISAVCETCEKLSENRCVYLVFCTQSAIAQRGAYPAAFGVKPDKALCVSPYNGKNFAVKVLDKSLVCDAMLTDKLYNTAVKYSETAERKVMPGEMSDAGKVQSAFVGVRVASIMMPVLNLGTAAEIFNTDNTGILSDIIAEFLNNI